MTPTDATAALTRLREQLASDTPAARVAALDGLAALGPAAMPALPDILARIVPPAGLLERVAALDALSAMRRLPDAAAPAVFGAYARLSDESPTDRRHLRLAMTGVLEAFDPAAFVDRLIREADPLVLEFDISPVVLPTAVLESFILRYESLDFGQRLDLADAVALAGGPAVPRLLQLLGDEATPVAARAFLATTLASSEYADNIAPHIPEVVDVLVALLESPDAGRRGRAVSSLGRLGPCAAAAWPALAALLPTTPELAPLVTALCAVGPAPLDFLARSLQSPDRQRRVQGVLGLGVVAAADPTAAVDLLLGAAAAADPDVRRAAVHALAQSCSHLPAVMRVLGRSAAGRRHTRQTRLAAIDGFRRTGPTAVAHLARFCASDDSEVRAAAIHVSAEWPASAEGETVLRRALRDRDEIRGVAFDALCRVGFRDVMTANALARMFPEHGDESLARLLLPWMNNAPRVTAGFRAALRSAASWGTSALVTLAKTEPDTVRPLTDDIERRCASSATLLPGEAAILATGERGLRLLFARLAGDGTVAPRARLARVLAESVDSLPTSARPDVERLLADPSPAVRAEAVRLLSRINPPVPDLFPWLLAFLGDRDPRRRRTAVLSLGDHKRLDTRPAVLGMLTDADAAVVAAAEGVLDNWCIDRGGDE